MRHSACHCHRGAASDIRTNHRAIRGASGLGALETSKNASNAVPASEVTSLRGCSAMPGHATPPPPSPPPPAAPPALGSVTLLLLSPPRSPPPASPAHQELFACRHAECLASFDEFLALRAHEVAQHKLQCAASCRACTSRQVRIERRVCRAARTHRPRSSSTGRSTPALIQTVPSSALIAASWRPTSASITTARRAARPALSSRAE